MNRFARLAALTFLAATQLSAAPPGGSAIPSIRIPDAQFVSSVNDVLMTSGASLEGLVAGSLTLAIPAAAITVGGIDSTDKGICVSIRQVSGSYRGDFKVLNPGRGRVVRFLLPARKFVGVGHAAGSFAILARADGGEGCTRTSPILPASWTGLQRDGRLNALVNDQQAFRVQTLRPLPENDCSSLASILPRGTVLKKYRSACSITPPPAVCLSTYRLILSVEANNEPEQIVRMIRTSC